MQRFTPLALFALTALASAQGSVIVVDDDGGPGVDFTHPIDAIQAAGDGDVVLVKGGFYYWSFTLPPIVVDGKSLAIVADEGIVGFFDTTLTVENLAANQSFVIRGVNLSGTWIELESNAGSVWIEDCQTGLSLASGPPYAQGRIEATGCASVVVSRSSIAGATNGVDNGPGIRSSASNVRVFESLVEGAQGSLFSELPGQPGVEVLNGGSFLASGCTLNGGAWFTGTEPGLLLASGAPAGYTRDTFATVDVQSGTHVVFPEFRRSCEVDSPVTEGQTTTLHFAGFPGDLTFAAVGTAPLDLLFPAYQGAFLVGPLPPPLLIAAGTIAPTGFLDVPLTAPSLAPGLEFASLWVQSAAVSALGVPTLGSASHLLVLDDAF